MLLLLIIVLLLFGTGGLTWGHRAGYYGAAPYGGGLGLVLLIVIIFLLFGR